MSLGRIALAAVFVFCIPFPSHAEDAYKWSVQYLIDQSRKVAGRSQQVYPRHNRALAISPDKRFLYAAYHQSYNGTGEVRKIDLNEPDYTKATVDVLHDLLVKSIAVDDEGRVYLASPDGIYIYNPNLWRLEYRISVSECEGLAVIRTGGKLILYGSQRSEPQLKRWEIGVGNQGVISAELKGFDGSGILEIPEAVSLRGLAVDSSGRIWIADHRGNKVFRVDADGKNLVSVEVKSPLAVGCDDGTVYVTQGLERQITILNNDMSLVGMLSVPWQELELAPFGNNRGGALAGIAIVHGKGFYVANERGQTANQKSTYGIRDDNTAEIDGKLFMDSFVDDNEPILHALPVALSARN